MQGTFPSIVQGRFPAMAPKKLGSASSSCSKSVGSKRNSENTNDGGPSKIRKVSDSKAIACLQGMSDEIAAANHRREALSVGKRVLDSTEMCNACVAAIARLDKQNLVLQKKS